MRPGARSNGLAIAVLLFSLLSALWLLASTTAASAVEPTPVTAGDPSQGESTDPTASTTSTAVTTTTTSSESSTTSTARSDASSTTTVTTAAEATPGTTTTTTPGESTTTTTLVSRPASQPNFETTEIPIGSVSLAVSVLAAMAVLSWLILRSHSAPSEQSLPAARVHDLPIGAPPETPGSESTLHTLRFLLELGRALLDAGETVRQVDTALADVAAVNGVHDLGTVVLPTALIISVPDGASVQSEVRTAGNSRLRMDQAEEILTVADRARRGDLTPLEGLDAISAARATPPRFKPPVQLLGATIYTVGLVLLMRGTWQDLVVAVVLGTATGTLQLAVNRSRNKDIQSYQAFWPLLAAFATSVSVLTLGRIFDELSVYPPILAPLVTFLPGGLLTTGVVELSGGEIISGAGRIASGLLRLVLLALGIVAGAQLVGVPPSSIGDGPQHPAAVIVAWLGVGVFGLGYYLYFGARTEAVPWILGVLYVAYAGQVLGGALFGEVLSAFFGAAAMTPVAMLAARQKHGPAMLVTFMPSFWLLVPGALGLEGITRLFGRDESAGITAMTTMFATMVAISLGVLVGLLLGSRISSLGQPLREWRSRDDDSSS